MSTAVEPLVAGQRMTRAEFHDRYAAMPPGKKFELIAGKVSMASPVGPRHGKRSFQLAGWLFHYVRHTPGVDGFENTSVALDDENEVQPDLLLGIEFSRGGRGQVLEGLIAGSPEFIIEVADSSRAVDLGSKRLVYERGSSLEYLVFTLQPSEIHWHIRQGERLTRIEPDHDGLYRSAAFPGLWLDPVALLAGDLTALLAALDRGLASPEHAAFLARLAAANPTGTNA